jgi:hypothetical protein
MDWKFFRRKPFCLARLWVQASLPLLAVWPGMGFAQTDSLWQIQLPDPSRNALPYTHCPVEIRFDGALRPDRLELRAADGSLAAAHRVHYPQYGFLKWGDCALLPGRYRVLLYRNDQRAPIARDWYIRP